jgi:putative oxidoreductase
MVLLALIVLAGSLAARRGYAGANRHCTDRGLEIVGGLLLIAGLFTRVIAVPFIIEMVVAILSTKISLYLGTSPLPLPPAPPTVGFWAVMHETRSDYAQILTSIFLLVVGPGSWSLDALLRRRREAAPAPRTSEDGHLLPAAGR